MSIARVERLWLFICGGFLVVFFVVLLAAAALMGSGPPSSMDLIDPQTVLVSGMFAHPGVTQTGPHSYLAHIAAYTFGFDPSHMQVPVGSKVTFHIATRDVIHGFEIVGTDVNTMVIPGYVSEITHTFTHKGSYLIICNEYCGSEHQLMYAHITIV